MWSRKVASDERNYVQAGLNSLLIRTGNIRTRDLKSLFQTHLDAIIAALEKNSLVELDRQEVRVIF